VSTPLPPKPVPDADTRPFWDAVASRSLIVQRCAACEKWIWQPKPMCNRCQTPEPVWTPVTGRARVVSWTVVHPPVLPVWQDAVPFVILLVELDDAPGVRMIGQLVGADAALLRTDGNAEGIDFDTAVEVRWCTDEAGQMLPAWTLR